MSRTLWIIDHYSSEPQYGGYTRQYNLAKGMAESGINVVVISSSFSHFSHSYISDKEMLISEVSENVHFVYLRTTEYLSNTGAKRFLGMLSFMHQIMRNYKSIEKKLGNPQWIVASSPHIFDWLVGRKIANKFGVDFNIEIRDFWPLELRTGNDSFAKGLLYNYFDRLETKSFKSAKHIICTFPYGDRYCDDYKKPGQEKFIYIGQPLDCDRFDYYAKENWNEIPEYIRDFIMGDFFCVFSGYYMRYEGVYQMLEAAAQLQDIKFLFVGSGNEEEGMKQYVKDHKLKNVLIGDRIKKEAVPALLKKSGICMAYLHDESNAEMFKYGMSKNKVNEYLYSGAVTIMGFDVAENEIEESGGGFTFRVEKNEFANYIQKVINMNEIERKAIGECGREYIRKTHNIQNLSRIYIDKVLD